MTTREEYEEAADKVQACANAVSDLPVNDAELSKHYDMQWTALDLAARVLRALADGAVLCSVYEDMPVANTEYIPLDPQP